MELRPWEKATYALIEEAAETGMRAPTADQIQEATGCSSMSTPSHIVKSLEKRGLLEVHRYQRERQIIVLATGKATAPVKNKAPHWRTRPRPASMPSVSVTYVNHRTPDLAREMMQAARKEGMSFQDFLAELVWAGWQQRASIQPDPNDA